MKCPYAITRIVTIHYENHFDENDRNDFSNSTETNAAIFVNCQKENCGAWQDGKCNYKGA